jgi:hypothetical protein
MDDTIETDPRLRRMMEESKDQDDASSGDSSDQDDADDNDSSDEDAGDFEPAE